MLVSPGVGSTRLSYWRDKVSIVTGASSGLGLAISRELLSRQAKLVAVARDHGRLEDALSGVSEGPQDVHCCAADVTSDSDMSGVTRQAVERFGRIDCVVACAGRSHRGKIEDLTANELRELLELNFLGAVRSVQPALSELIKSRGHVVLIGSLAAKTASPYLGGYPASKFPLAAYAQQLRLELGDRGLHSLLVCPGPLARIDAGSRYDELAEGLPDSARRPGGGAKLKGIDPSRLARSILDACRRRRSELIIPPKARILFILQQLNPRWGDWLVKKMTRS